MKRYLNLPWLVDLTVFTVIFWTFQLQDITPMLPTISNPDLFWLSEAVDHYPKTSVQAINFTQAAVSTSENLYHMINTMYHQGHCNQVTYGLTI